MRSLSIDELGTVFGGMSETDNPDGSFHYKQSQYESCIHKVESEANKRFPDNRWFFQRWFGAKDDNADARAEFIKKTAPDQCGMPQT